MIGVEGQWELRLSIEGLTDSDFVTGKNLVYFRTTKEVGNILPAFTLIFDSDNRDILSYIKEKNIIISALGDGRFFGPSQEWLITTHETQRYGDSKYRIKIEGLLNKLPFITQSRIKITDKISSVDAIAEVASKYFNVIKNTSSADNQYWIQPNITDRVFIQEILKTAFKPDNFILVGIDDFNFFFIKDGIALLEEDFFDELKYNGSEADLSIPFNSDYIILNRTGIMGSWIGKERSKVLFRHEDGFLEQSDIPFGSFNPNDERSPNLGYRYNHQYLSNENTHPDIQPALTLQKAGPAFFSNYQIRVDYALSKLDGVNIFSIVNFVDDALDSLKTVANQNISGKYIVGKVISSITPAEYSKDVYLYKPTIG